MAYKWEGQDIIAPLTFRSNQTTWTVEKLDKSIDRTTHPSQRWELDFGLTTNTNEGDIMVALTDGFGDEKTMVMPSIVSAKEYRMFEHPIAGEVETVGNVSAGTTVVTLRNSNAEAKYVGKAAFLQFANHNKVYMMRGARMLSPNNTLPRETSIFPNLREDVPEGTEVYFYDDVTLHHYVSSDAIQGLTYTDGILMQTETITVLESV